MDGMGALKEDETPLQEMGRCNTVTREEEERYKRQKIITTLQEIGTEKQRYKRWEERYKRRGGTLQEMGRKVTRDGEV